MNALHRGALISAFPWAVIVAMGLYMWTNLSRVSKSSLSDIPTDGFILSISINFNTREGLSEFKRRY